MDEYEQRILDTLADFYDNLHEELCTPGMFCSAHRTADSIIEAIRRDIGQEITDEINADPEEVARLRAARQEARGWRRVPLKVALEDTESDDSAYEEDEPVEQVRAAFERAVKHLTAPPPRIESPTLGAWRERHEIEVRRIAERLVSDHAAILERLRETDVYNEAMQAAADAAAQDQREQEGDTITHRRTCNLVALRPDRHGSSALVCSCDYWQRVRAEVIPQDES